MADKVNITKERIVYEVVGAKETVKVLEKIRDVMNSLESRGASLVPTGEVEDLKKKIAEMEKEMNLLNKSSAKASDLFEQTFGKGTFANVARIRTQLGAVKYGLWEMVDALDAATSFFMESRKRALELASSGGKVMEGWGWTRKGTLEMEEFGAQLDAINVRLGLNTGKVSEMVGLFQKGGANFRQLSGQLSEASTTALDNAYLLYGGLDKVGESIRDQATLMENFSMSVMESDSALKGIAIDAHVAGMANERFIGTVKDISSEMDLYGGHLRETGKLLSVVAKHAGDARAIKDTQTLVSTLKNLSVEQRVFFMRAGKNLGIVSKAFEEDLSDLSSRAEAAEASARGARASGKFDFAEGEERRARELRGRESTLRGYKEALGRGAGPITESAAMGALDPIKQLRIIMAGIPGLSGDRGVDLRGASGRLEELVPQIAGTMKMSLMEATEFVRVLQTMQGKSATLDAALQGDPKTREKFEELFADAAVSQADRVKQLVENFRGWKDYLSQLMDNFRTSFFQELRREIDDLGIRTSDIRQTMQAVLTISTTLGGLVAALIPSEENREEQRKRARAGEGLEGFLHDREVERLNRFQGTAKLSDAYDQDMIREEAARRGEQLMRDRAMEEELRLWKEEEAKSLREAARSLEGAAKNLHDATNGRTVKDS